MALKLSIMEEEDIPEFAEVDDMAMANWGLAQAMSRSNPTNEPRKRMIEEYMHKGFHADSRLTYLKVTDAETGEMVSAAVWRFVLEPEEGQSKDEAHEEESDETSKNNPNVPKEPGVSKGAGTPSVMVEMQRLWTEFRDECFPNQPYANLQVLLTHPKHQRRGAGSMLVKWGCDKADERDLISVLQASQAGLNIYLKHGFEIEKVVELDLRPYGVDETEVRRGMVRQPQPKHSEEAFLNSVG